MKVLLPLAALISAGITLFLLLAWVLGRPLFIRGSRLEPEPLLIAIGYTVGIYLYWRNRGSPHRLAASYLKFLRERGLPTRRVWSVALLLRAGRHALTLSEDVSFDLLYNLGVEEFTRLADAEARPPAATPPREGKDDGNKDDGGDEGVASARNLALVSVALFSEGESKMRAHACRELARDGRGVRLVFAYLDLSEDLAEKVAHKAVVHLPLGSAPNQDEPRSDLPHLAGPRIRQRARELGARGFDRELRLVCETLERGEWPASLPFVLRAAYDPTQLGPLTVSLQELLSRKPWLMEALRRLFVGLPGAVIERYLASRQSDAYLLTFVTPDRGSIARALNELADPELILSLMGAMSYHWEQYTGNARIGLVPRETNLEHFAARLQSDLSMAVSAMDGLKKEQTDGGEVILHRLGLSGRDYYQVEIPAVTERQSIIKLRRLLAHGLDTPELLSVLDYAHPPLEMLDRLIDSPLLDLVGPLDAEERKQLAYINNERNGEKGDRKEGERDEVQRDLLRGAVLKALRVKTPAELVARLGKRGPKITDIEVGAQALLSVLLNQRHLWEIERLRTIVTSYFETLQALSALSGKG